MPSAVQQITAQPGEAVETGLREILLIVLKHWRLIAVCAMLGLLTGWMYCKFATPSWQSTVTIKLPGENNSDDPMQELLQMNSSEDPEETYIEIAKSLNVAMRVAKAVDLTDTAQFSSARSLEDAAAAVRSCFQVTTIEGSGILSFTVKAHDPRLAVRLANAWAQAFIDINLDFNRAGADSRRRFIESQLVDLKLSLSNGEEALAQLAKRQHLVRQASPSGMDADSPIMGLQTRIQELEIERITLASRYTNNDSRVRVVDAEYREATQELNRLLNQMPTEDLEYKRLARDVNANEAMYNLLLEKDQEARIAENVDDSGIVIVDAASPAGAPVSPQKRRIMLASLVLAVLLGVLAAVGLDQWLDHIGGESELSDLSGLPVLAMIPDWRFELKNAVALTKNDSKSTLKQGQGKVPVRQETYGLINLPELRHTYYIEAFKVLRTNLAFSQVDKQTKSICVLSANASEGKTTTNANLALAMAATGKRVLLVDADLRKPNVHKIFNLKVRPEQGLPFLLSGQASLESQLVEGPIPELTLLPCGVTPPNPSELIGSDVFERVLKQMCEKFDQVVFDAPPLLPVTDGVLLATHLDGVVVVARYERTRRAELTQALNYLAAAKAPVLGMILNAVDMKKYSYRQGYRSRNYEYHGKS